MPEGEKVNVEQLKTLPKNEIPQLAKQLSISDVDFLVKTLSEKDDAARYTAFLLLQANSRQTPLVYAHWDELKEKLGNVNSYQRSLGLMLIAENVKWDQNDRFNTTIDSYLTGCSDKKFITARQAIHGLANVVNATSKYNTKIKQALTNLTFDNYKENQQRLLKKDITGIMELIKKS
jgi:hypothetical protein